MSLSILVGTTKGAFVLGEHGAVSGPHCDGWGINHVVGDPETGTLFAGGGGDWEGAGVWRSSDGGETWELSALSSGQRDKWAANDPEFAAMIGWKDTPLPFGEEFGAVWSLRAHDGKVYAGTKPAQLLVSSDGGRTWEKNAALAGFEGRDDWNAGAAGLVLHTIVPDGARDGGMWLGISAAGVFATEDGGATWERRNRLSNAEACEGHNHPAAPANGEIGHCVHNMVQSGDGARLYQQNHHGVWRSSDGGRSWDEAGHGLPSTFGFPIGVHPKDPDRIWTIPLNGDSQGRYPVDARAAVWTSADGGESWEAITEGLPRTPVYFTVLRQAMAVADLGDEAGVFFGTNTGSVFGSHDSGRSWREVASHLPTILSVEAFVRH